MTNPNLAETPFHLDPLEYEISEEDGIKTAKNPLMSLTILKDGQSKIFKRRAIKEVGGGSPSYHTALVGELDGVRVYIKDGDIILTKQNLRL